jgi:hypothetical protein
MIIIRAMILNGFGFHPTTIKYIFPNFFWMISTEKLLDKGIVSSDLNYDVVGRTLNAIYGFSATERFNGITLHILKWNVGLIAIAIFFERRLFGSENRFYPSKYLHTNYLRTNKSRFYSPADSCEIDPGILRMSHPVP